MEIEVKARLENAQSVKQKLVALGCEFSSPKTQDDMVWVENTGSLETFLANKVFLRTRIQNDGKVFLTAKVPKDRTGDGSLIKSEYEVSVDSIEAARGILKSLGLREMVRVIKTRETAHYKDYEICIDDIDDLGSFIELEKIGTVEEAEKVQLEMIDFLEVLGIPASDRTTKGYDILMLERLITL